MRFDSNAEIALKTKSFKFRPSLSDKKEKIKKKYKLGAKIQKKIREIK